LGRGSPHQPNWLFWGCKPTYFDENKTYLTLIDKITIFPVKIGIICHAQIIPNHYTKYEQNPPNNK
jgi:hypothetical protein